MSTSSRLSELRQITLNARGPNSSRSLGLKARRPIKDTVSPMSLSSVLYGLATHRTSEAQRCL